MSLFDWFKRKPAAAPQRAASSAAPARAEAPALHSPVPPSETAQRHRTERMERREQLYAVVRDAMVRAGVLSASYKFKVLALDQRGHQFLVMMDLAREYGSETAHLSNIEGVITQAARTRHAIAVTAVYWRINDLIAATAAPRDTAPADPAAPLLPAFAGAGVPAVAAPAVPPAGTPARPPVHPVHPRPAAAVPVAAAPPRSAAHAAPAAAATAAAFVPPAAPAPSALSAPSDRLVAPRFDPIEADEVAAFRQALAGAALQAPPAPPVAGVSVRSGPRHTSFSESEFPDTQLPEEYAQRTRNSDLSNTQYGDL